jgi:hypothetical protein
MGVVLPLPLRSVAGKTPEQRADLVQLAMANSLGTLAAARTSHELFGMQKGRLNKEARIVHEI